MKLFVIALIACAAFASLLLGNATKAQVDAAFTSHLVQP